MFLLFIRFIIKSIMEIEAIAHRLVELCRLGDFEKARVELYASQVVSIEPSHRPNNYVEGFEAVHEKGKVFESMVEEVHRNIVSDPIIANNFICFKFEFDVTMKGRPRMNLDELCVYEIKDGKIVREQFFF